MSDIAQIISTLGFPIFSASMMFMGMKYVYDKERKSLDDTIGKLASLTEAVNHNSETVSRLVDEMNDKREKEETV